MLLAELILVEPFKASKHILIDKNPFVIGRTDDCHLVLSRSSISKRHAEIRCDGAQYVITDLASKNGVLVNGQAMKEAVLKNRDLISLGGFDLNFQTVQPEQWKIKLGRNLEQFRSALETTTAMNSHKVLESLLDEIMDAVMRLSQGQRGFLMLSGPGGGLDIVRSVNFESDQFEEQPFTLSKTAIQKAVDEKRSVAVSNALADTFFGRQTSIRNLSLQTLVCVPIVVQDRVTGVIYADSSRIEQEFTDLDVEVLEYMAGHAGIAIENARLNSEMRQLIQNASDLLAQVESSTQVDGMLRSSIHDTLQALGTLQAPRPAVARKKRGTALAE